MDDYTLKKEYTKVCQRVVDILDKLKTQPDNKQLRRELKERREYKKQLAIELQLRDLY